MRIARTVSELHLDRENTIALVPTMGAFHEGHLHLMRAAAKEAHYVVVSLFVNPTQFRAGEDFEKYPRDEGRDFELAEASGVDLLFVPTVEEMYPGSLTTIHIDGVTKRWEGEFRPGHFDGVATVVAKLFSIVRPDVAVFGWKDFQQCMVIRQLVQDLHFQLRLHFEPTVREDDGLAMSSRNRFLSDQERSVAPALYAGLVHAAELIRGGVPVGEVLDSARADLNSKGFAVDYFALVDGLTLEPIGAAQEDARLIAAAKLGTTRLIDNIPLVHEPAAEFQP